MTEYTLNIRLDLWTRFMKNFELRHFSLAGQNRTYGYTTYVCFYKILRHRSQFRTDFYETLTLDVDLYKGESYRFWKKTDPMEPQVWEKMWLKKWFFAVFLDKIAFFRKNCSIKKYSKPHFLFKKKIISNKWFHHQQLRNRCVTAPAPTNKSWHRSFWSSLQVKGLGDQVVKNAGF